MNTLVWWAITGFLFLLLAGLIGRQATYVGSDGTEKKGLWIGILVDERLRFSLTKLQMVLWTLVFLSLLTAVFLVRLLDNDPSDALQITIPPEILALVGISAGSAVLTTAIKSPRTESIRYQAVKLMEANMGVKPAAGSAAGSGIVGMPSHLSQVFLVEQGDAMDKVVDVTKFQNFFLTLIAVGAYVVMAAGALAGTSSPAGLPGFSQDLLWLIGISHAAYVGGKIPGTA
jgi:hypothetical protein